MEPNYLLETVSLTENLGAGLAIKQTGKMKTSGEKQIVMSHKHPSHIISTFNHDVISICDTFNFHHKIKPPLTVIPYITLSDYYYYYYYYY